MKELIAYKEALKAVHDYFGFVEHWQVYPIDDATKYWWIINDGEVLFYDSFEAYGTQDGIHSYSNEIFYNVNYQTIWKGKEYTMILVDTHTDGNRFLQIFDNSKKIM